MVRLRAIVLVKPVHASNPSMRHMVCRAGTVLRTGPRNEQLFYGKGRRIEWCFCSKPSVIYRTLGRDCIVGVWESREAARSSAKQLAG